MREKRETAATEINDDVVAADRLQRDRHCAVAWDAGIVLGETVLGSDHDTIAHRQDFGALRQEVLVHTAVSTIRFALSIDLEKINPVPLRDRGHAIQRHCAAAMTGLIRGSVHGHPFTAQRWTD